MHVATLHPLALPLHLQRLDATTHGDALIHKRLFNLSTCSLDTERASSVGSATTTTHTTTIVLRGTGVMMGFTGHLTIFPLPSLLLLLLLLLVGLTSGVNPFHHVIKHLPHMSSRQKLNALTYITAPSLFVDGGNDQELELRPLHVTGLSFQP